MIIVRLVFCVLHVDVNQSLLTVEIYRYSSYHMTCEIVWIYLVFCVLYVNQSDDSVHRYYCINHVCSMFVIYKILNQNKTITSTVEVVAQVALSNINLYDDNPHARKKLRCQEYCKQTGADISIKIPKCVIRQG